jgi:hypothetical protein
MWEAVRTLPGRRLLALVLPVTGSDAADPGYAPLSTLLKLERPVSGSKGSDLVIWIDDAQLHLQHGLTRDNLRRLVERYPKVAVVLTIHSNALDGIKDFDAPLHVLLRQPCDELILRPVLSPAELAAAMAAYPSLAENTDLASALTGKVRRVAGSITGRWGSKGDENLSGVGLGSLLRSWRGWFNPGDRIGGARLLGRAD